MEKANQKSEKEYLKEFFTLARTKGKDITLEDIKRIEEESYDMP